MCVSSLSASPLPRKGRKFAALEPLCGFVERYTVLSSSLRVVESLIDRNPAFYTEDTGKDEGDRSTRDGGNL